MPTAAIIHFRALAADPTTPLAPAPEGPRRRVSPVTSIGAAVVRLDDRREESAPRIDPFWLWRPWLLLWAAPTIAALELTAAVLGTRRPR